MYCCGRGWDCPLSGCSIFPPSNQPTERGNSTRWWVLPLAVVGRENGKAGGGGKCCFCGGQKPSEVDMAGLMMKTSPAVAGRQWQALKAPLWYECRPPEALLLLLAATAQSNQHK